MLAGAHAGPGPGVCGRRVLLCRVCVLHAGRPGRRGAGRRPSRRLATGDVRRPCPKIHMKIC